MVMYRKSCLARGAVDTRYPLALEQLRFLSRDMKSMGEIVTPPPQMSLPWPRTEDSSQYSQRIAGVSLHHGSEGPLWTAWSLQEFCVPDGILQNMHGSIQHLLNTYSVLSCFLNTKMNRSHSLSPQTLNYTQGDNTHNS